MYTIGNLLTNDMLDADFLPESVYRHSLDLLGVEDHQSRLIDPNAGLSNEPVPLTATASYSRKSVDLSSVPIHRTREAGCSDHEGRREAHGLEK